MISNSSLHYAIIKGIIEKGYAPNVEELSIMFTASNEGITTLAGIGRKGQ